MLQRLYANWVYGGVLAGVMLFALTPLLAVHWSWLELFVFLALPIYMLHQYEEHDDDRFRSYVNSTLANGRVGLSLADVFVINIGAVWALLTGVLWLVHRADGGWATVAAYLLLINGTSHIISAFAMRAYNPGLVTAVAAFLPLGGTLLWALWPVATAVQHMVGLAIVIGVHGWIAVHARRAQSSGVSAR